MAAGSVCRRFVLCRPSFARSLAASTELAASRHGDRKKVDTCIRSAECRVRRQAKSNISDQVVFAAARRAPGLVLSFYGRSRALC